VSEVNPDCCRDGKIAAFAKPEKVGWHFLIKHRFAKKVQVELYEEILKFEGCAARPFSLYKNGLTGRK